MSSTAASMDGPLDNLGSHHFALLYIDESGKLRFEASSSVANDCHGILSPEVTHSFLKAVAVSEDGMKLANSSEANYETQSGKSASSPDSPGSPNFSRRSSISQLIDNNQKRKRASHEYVLPMSITCYPQTLLPIRNQSLLRKYYEKAFDSLQQTNCRILAKAYIKLVEPRKQVNYPYNGRKNIAGVPNQFDPEETKPGWWPAGVIHREPDHLRKPERIRLLVHILCELRESHSICVDNLKEADQSIRRQIAPIERLQVLDEIYRVRGEEERYLNGNSDGQGVVSVSRVHLPDMADPQASLYSPVGSILESDNTSRDDVPDLESHTSVFPSSNISASNTSFNRQQVDATSNAVPPVSVLPSAIAPTTWDACHSSIPVSTSLPPINPAMKHSHSDPAAAHYGLDFSTSIFPHHEPIPAFAMQSFPMEPYANLHPHMASHIPHQSGEHQNHPQSHATVMPLVRTPGPNLSGCPPYYFDY
ncbi:hypothetical protein ASPVEDRAFT_684132 [Aspergillus versicolor CBS 583.65]|uniref:Subtelomeric hrmA-associated cluster protein AFUB-079030/YDR124W-like helical bundle domain-containing protein n=1 Tax=Aspergillus versicolor CBS 583.65 TaxID=1036611 RepID=A0A1L9PMF0_ASPVE|nr:uncharacterized protein ASPVEDRAFT_684132 [Aspergillus versicolor CBS 583.65]OJJ02595.1 hypothetical protein ASPVEDRAFT_684132 [Aspergillus versicolor CBS 583.65]